MTKAPPTVFSALRARIGRSQLVVGIGVLAAVVGAVLAAPMAAALMHWARSSQHTWMVVLTHTLVSRLWVYLVLPLMWLGLSRIVVDLSPWPVAVGSALAGELAYLTLDWFGGTLVSLLHFPSVWIPRGLTFFLGVFFSARAIRWSQSSPAQAQP